MAEEETEQFEEEEYTDEEATPDDNDILLEEPVPVHMREEEPEKEAEPEVVEEKERSEFDERHFQWGRMLDLDKQSVEAFGDPEVFEQMVKKVGEVMGNSRAADAPPASEPVHKGFLLEEEFADESLVAMNRHYNDEMSSIRHEIEGLRNTNSSLVNREKERMAQQSASEFDRICNTLDEDLFGRGTYEELGSENADNRVDLANAVSRLGHGYSARGEDVPPMPELVEQAKGAIFGNQIEKQTLRKASEKTKANRSQTSAVPTHKEAAPLSAEETATKAAYEWQKEKGWI